MNGTLLLAVLGCGRAARSYLPRCRLEFGVRQEESFTIGTGGRGYVLRSLSDRHWPASGAARRALDAVGTIRRRLVRRQSSLTRAPALQLRAFADVVRGRIPPSPGTLDGVAATQAIEAARLSLAHGGLGVAVPATPSL
ncbi:MAG TPA: hypothetical protein VMY76_07205 [Gemmatimonadales bacterium]|nr:hypothetical protein [Gemmatimonadales bacterium]